MSIALFSCQTKNSPSINKYFMKRKFTKFCSWLSMIFLVLIISKQSFGQVANYTFAQSSGTYTAVSSPTSVHASGWDDGVASVTIPFSFNFNGIAYTSVSVNTNGYLTFGSTVSATNSYIALSATTGYAGAVGAYARDLISNASTIVYGVEGASPNRVFVIQWNNAMRYNSTAGVTGDVLNFQIRLSETTNTVAVRYGTCTITSTTTGLTGQVGLRGAANTDYNNRSSSTTWASTIAGTANTATVTTLNTITPASGLTFTWTPPAACVTPTAQPTTLSLTSVTASTLSGSFTAAIPAPSGYLVVRSASSSLSSGPVDGTIYTAAGSLGGGTVVQVGATTTFSQTALTANTPYIF